MTTRRCGAGRDQGFSVLEATIVIAAAAIVATTASGRISEYLDVARTVKARGDVRVLASSVLQLVSDVGGLKGINGVPPSLLVGEGDAPEPETDEARPWALPVDGALVQPLSAHMVDNTAGYRMGATGSARWRGPYVEGLGSDPWGSRYAINVGCLTAPGYVTLVVSAGPDRMVSTPFASMVMASGRGDDVVALAASGKDTISGATIRPGGDATGNLCGGAGRSPHP